MTVGEKIQLYRKRNGLSQEELGQKLLVSRQTVSLWEMDRTLPTVDNLLRLKEIFSVSVDDILSEEPPREEPLHEEPPCENPPAEEPNPTLQPRESYTFTYDKTDLRAVYRKMRRPLVKRTVLFILACAVLFVFLTVAEANETVIGLLMGFFLLGIITHVGGYLTYRKAWKATEGRVLASTYAYDMFDGYFILNITRDGEVTKTEKIRFAEVERIHPFGGYLVLQIHGQTYILKKDALIPDSAFTTLCQTAPEKVAAPKAKDPLKAVAILLYVLSGLTLWGALFVVAMLTEINHAMTENMWAFFLFLPIPLASIVFGFYLKKRKRKYKTNVIVGFIMAAVLTIYGCFSFGFSGLYSHSDEPIRKAEQLLDMDIPTHTRITTQDWTKGTQSIPRGYVYYTSDVYFDAAAVEDFEKSLASDSRWLTAIPNDLVGITSYLCDLQPGDYTVIYNMDSQEFGTLPKESGTYRFLNLLYDAEENVMRLVEYEIDYTK